MPKHHGYVLDRGPGLPAQLRCRMSEHVRRDSAQAGRLAVAPQMGVQGCGRDRERQFGPGPYLAEPGCPRSLDGSPGGRGELPAANAAALRADLVSGGLPGSGLDEPQADKLAAAEPGEQPRHDNRPVEQAGRRVGNGSEQPGDLRDRQAARRSRTRLRATDVCARIPPEHLHPAGEVVEARHSR